MEEVLELLIYSFDNELTEKEQVQLNAGLLTFPELQEEKKKYLSMRAAFSSLSFAEKVPVEDQVIEKWNTQKRENNFQHNVIRLFPKVAAAAILFFFLTWFCLHFLGDNLTMDQFLLIGEISPDEANSLLEVIK